MNIITKNVLFGDCTLIEEDDQIFLVDCGSKNKGTSPSSSSFAYAAIDNEIKSNSITNILVTHFDLDHFNGVLKIADTYKACEQAYLPESIVETIPHYALVIASLISVAPKGSFGFRLSNNIVKLFLKLTKLSKNGIAFVKRGDHISYGSETYDVLWPEINERILTAAEEVLNLPSFVRLRALVGELYPALSEEISAFSAILQSFVQNLHDNPESPDENEYFYSLSNLYRSLLEQREYFYREIIAQNNNSIKKSLQALTLKTYHKLIKSFNAMSVVIHCSEKVLLLGDAPVEVIDIIQSDFDASYKVIKIQHHGTSAYYTPNVLKAEFHIISNGGYSHTSWNVDTKNVGINKTICTGAHHNPKSYCCYFKKHSSCNKDCIKVIHPSGYKITI